MARTLTTCPYCGCGCGLYLISRGQELIGVEPAPGHPISRGQLCVKGWNAYEFVGSPERLTHPLVRENGGFQEVSWEEALDRVVEGLKRIQEAQGPDSLAFFSSAKTTNEENFLFMKLARAVFGTNNVDHCARLCHSPTVAGMAACFGSGAMTNSINELEKAEVILVIGSNTTEQHPLIGTRIIEAARSGTKLIVADPLTIRLSRFATINLHHRSGTDVALLNGIMHIIIAEGLQDEGFLAERTENYSELERLVKDYPPEKVSRITGVAEEDIRKVARMYAGSRRSMIFYAMGITQHISGTDNVRSCANLAMLTGNIGRESTGVNPLRGQNNVQGACDMGALPNVFSGYQSVEDPSVRAKFEKAWGIERLPEKPGLGVTLAVKAAETGEVKGMYIMAENPMLSDPDLNHTRRALENLDFLVVQDIFMTETAELADVVLPGASYAEKEGTFTNTERRVLRVGKAIEPVGRSRADWQIICEVARRAGYGRMQYDGPEEVMNEINVLTPSYGGITYERITPWGRQWPCPDRKHPGTPFLHKDKFTRGRGRFLPVAYIPADELPDEEYDFTLTSGRIYFHFHTGTMTRRTAVLNREEPGAFAEINPDDARERKIYPGELIRVSSRRGTIRLPARLTERMPRGMVSIPFHFREAAANLLTNPALDPAAKIPEYKVCAVKIGKLNEDKKD
jgi:formate dehydrogenase alpha subunit